ncbi:MAG TPA: SGNH/GDSL hydrolase family protein [Candidatus Eisenbergiella merdipullorum]|uniref:SGNH/GDSL hydrolase family protein n=1 Tax=Candidatus Eisenbergiella merdipullorum TaxID=2838553 RepID=A0A9D2L0Q5_9FIRM|nr:SGNH/GDSL hydrolase family protein [Candidatus Eisenbergiella merdipullorum]
MKKIWKTSLLSAALALTLSFGAAPLTSQAADVTPLPQAAAAPVTTAAGTTAAPANATAAPADTTAAAGIAAAVPAASLHGKKLSILGDSISTFTGTMPADYNIFYPESGDIPNAGQTWWGQLLANTGMVLCRNASSANTDVTGNSLALDGSAPGCSIRRIVDLRGTDGSSPDVIVIYMGINDFARSRTLGRFTAPSVQTEGEVMTFTDAYEMMLQKIKALYPAASVYCCTLLERCDANGNTGAPAVNSNGNTVADYNAQIKAIAAAYGASIIDFYNCGINYTNLDLFTVDGIHPTWIGAGVLGQCATQAVLSTAI